MIALPVDTGGATLFYYCPFSASPLYLKLGGWVSERLCLYIII